MRDQHKVTWFMTQSNLLVNTNKIHSSFSLLAENLLGEDTVVIESDSNLCH